MDDELPPEHVSPIELEPCNICGRKFNPDTLARHKGICIKTKKKQSVRKTFDAAKQRAAGTDLEVFKAHEKYNKTSEDRLKIMAYERQAQKKKQWKRKHDEFISTIRSAREYDIATKNGASVPPPEPSRPNPDYVQCPYCRRRFQEHAAERHIPFCKEQNSRIERKSSATGSALNKRLKYKPPVIRKRTGTEDPSENYHPPGSYLVKKRTNFSSTYTVNGDGNDTDYRSPGGRKGGPVSSNRPPVGGTTVQNLPGNTSTIHKPHPPSRLPPPRIRSRLIHFKHRADENHITNNQNEIVNGYLSESDEQEQSELVENSHSQIHVRNPLKHPLLSKRSTHLEKSHSNNSVYQQNNTYSSDHETSAKPYTMGMERIHSNSSSGSAGGGGGSGNTIHRSKHAPLNKHGMAMSKFCYECGSGFPVPQAKYCCECGTKRI